jgi:sugar/nucleoside kinase (ribokinase family)
MQVLKPCLPHLNYFIPSLPEAQAITGHTDPLDVGRTLLEYGPQTVALKMGDRGCLVLTQDGQQLHLPAYDVPVLDATGAGDAFAAGFITGVWHGWPIERTAAFANAVGALCVMGVGATGGIRSFAETIEFMQSTPIKNLA